MSFRLSPLGYCLLLPVVLLTSACGEEKNQGDSATAQQMPPVALSVVSAEPQALPVTNNLPGRIAPTRIAEVRPRVSGIVVERVFEQGSIVREGDVLYRIDPAPFRVQVESAAATLQRAKAVQAQSRQQANRQEALIARNATSAQQRDDAIAMLAQADADVAVAESGLAAARLNLEYAEVRAPISGRTGRALITEGALVSSTENLVTIQQIDPIYADFTQSADELLTLRRALKLGALTGADAGAARVRLLYDNGTAYPHTGKLLFSEATVDPTTGQVTLRGEFPNPDGDLLPGLYVRVLIEQGVEDNAIAVPQQAIQRDGAGQPRLHILKDDGTLELRPIKTGRTLDSLIVVTDGLKAGEKVVVEGFQKIRPGVTFTGTHWQPGNSAPTAPGKGG